MAALHRKLLFPARDGLGLLWLAACWVSWARQGAADDNGGVLALDLLPASNASAIGTLGVQLGSSKQPLELLATIYSNTDAPLEIPVAALCEPGNGTETGLWNVIRAPAAGDVLVSSRATVIGSSAGMEVVSWSPSLGISSLSLSLRKGMGSDVRNITVVEDQLANSGQYPWNVTGTYESAKLQPGSDYSLMLWADSPPRRSISGYFTITNSSATASGTSPPANSATSAVTAQQRTDMQDCLSFLSAHGGYYNQTKDQNFQVATTFKQEYSKENSSWTISNIGGGSTSVGLSGNDSSGQSSDTDLQDIGMDLVTRSSIGMGMVSLNGLQTARNAAAMEMNVVALNLGTPNHTGSAVLGGYDENLIDPEQRATFAKPAADEGNLLVTVTALDVGQPGVHTSVYSGSFGSSPLFTLAYESEGIRLPKSMLDALLPFYGSPTFDEGLNGYVYGQGATVPDDTNALLITVNNGSSTAMITVPPSSLLVTETTEDNPLTLRNETGRTYMQLSSTPDGSDGAYLGRAFLQHVYFIDSPSSINKFHLAGLPSDLPTSKKLIAGNSSTVSLFDTSGDGGNSSSTKSNAGPIAGGIVGGIFVLFVIALFIVLFFFKKRLTRVDGKWTLSDRKLDGQNNSFGSNDKSLEKKFEEAQAARMHGAGMEKPGSIQTSATIPIHYEPSMYTASSTSGHGPVRAYGRTTRSQSTPQPAQIQYPEEWALAAMSEESSVRRNSEVSTVAREYAHTASSVLETRPSTMDEPYGRPPQRSATVGRIYSGELVRRVENASPAAPRTPGRSAFGHVRTASMGKVCTPTPIELENGSVVGGSVKSRRSSSTQSSAPSFTPPQPGSLAEVVERDRRRTRSGRSSEIAGWDYKSHSQSHASHVSRETESSSIYGLNAVTQDGEFVSLKDASGFLDSDSAESMGRTSPAPREM